MDAYRKLFEIPKNKRLQHTCYKWNDSEYSDFMISILKCMEPRFYHENELLYEELQEILEMTFVMKGSFLIGYEINKKKKFKIHIRQHSHFGGYNCIFNKKSLFIYKCLHFIEGFACRRAKWMMMEDKFPEMMNDFKIKLLSEYERNIRGPMMLYKQKDLDKAKKYGTSINVLAIKTTGQLETSIIEHELELNQKEFMVNQVSIEKNIQNMEKLFGKIFTKISEEETTHDATLS